MGKKVLLKEASKITGLSEWELRIGVKNGKYPALKVGSGRGKYIFDLDLLNDRIVKLMLENVCERKSDTIEFSKIRKIVS